MASGSLVFLVVCGLIQIGESSFCSFDLVGRCGIQHNADNGHGVVASTAVNFTGCQCSGDQFSSAFPVESTCLGDDMWSQDPPTCTPAMPCILPDVDFPLQCSSCELPTDTNEFCVGDGIAGECPRDEVFREAVCQCDGYWSVDICPPIACDETELQQCGSNFNYSNPVSYYGTVPPNTTVTFDSECDTEEVRTSFCQENGQWLIEGACVLPEADSLTIYCEGDVCRKKHFCPGETIAGLCPLDGAWRQPECQCDGYWSIELCPPISCDTAELQQCGSGFTYTSTPSYYGRVPSNTTATFNFECDGGAVATSFCQENGQWLTQGASVCTLPEVDGFTIKCGDKSCASQRRTHFCEGETISGTCNLDGRYRKVTCQCDGYWSAEICPASACSIADLQQCGTNFNLSVSPSYYGTVPPNTTATFNSKCDSGIVATSVCQENGQWLTQGANMCLLPEANGITLFCAGGSCSSVGRTQFCEGENITGICNLDGIDRRTFCQCDGMWSIEICPPPSCDVMELKQCGHTMEISSSVSYYGTVEPCTIATFEAFENECNGPVPVKSVCQLDGRWLTEGISTCTLPTSHDTGIIVQCRDPNTDNFINCGSLRRSHFCEDEEVKWTCNGKTVVATCQCDGTWSEEICLPSLPATQSPVLCPDSSIYNFITASTSSSLSTTAIKLAVSSSTLGENFPMSFLLMGESVTPSSSLVQPPLETSAVTWVPIVAVVIVMLVVCALLGVLVAAGLLYRKRRQKPSLSLEPVKFTNTDSVLAIAVNPLSEDNPGNYTAVDDDNPAPVSMYENSMEPEKKSMEPEHFRTTTFSQRYQQDPCMRKEELDPLSPENDSPYEEPPLTEQGVISLLEKYKTPCISENALTLLDELGSGEFGEVYKGKLEKSKDRVLEVAVKTVKHGPKEEQGRKALLQEAALMAQFKHPNIITMYGVCIGEKLMVATELMQRGDLRSHLLSIRKDSDSTLSENLSQLLLSFCRHVAAGMSYLSSKMFIHRDLAARNILVSGDLICKIADFGLSRVVDEEDDVYWSSGGLVAVKWAAPESLLSFQYSSASDVWSFAVTMFEIWSLGYKPYHEYSNTQAVKKIKEGYRLPPPPGCPRDIYELMIECWHPNSDHRPEFGVIVTRLNRPDYILLKLPQDGNKDALTLKAPLKHSQDLYVDLQQQYFLK